MSIWVWVLVGVLAAVLVVALWLYAVSEYNKRRNRRSRFDKRGPS